MWSWKYQKNSLKVHQRCGQTCKNNLYKIRWGKYDVKTRERFIWQEKKVEENRNKASNHV